MRVTPGGADFHPTHAVRGVAVLRDVVRLDRLDEARPAGARVELVGGGEERLPRDHVHVDAGLVVVPERVPERRLGGATLGDVVLFRRQPALELGIGRALGGGHGTCEYNPARQLMSDERRMTTNGIGLTRLQHLVLWVSDVERSVRFYRDVL